MIFVSCFCWMISTSDKSSVLLFIIQNVWHNIRYNSLLFKFPFKMSFLLKLNSREWKKKEREKHIISYFYCWSLGEWAKSDFFIIFIGPINSMAWVRKRTIPTERPPLVGATCHVPRGQRDGSLRPYSRFSRQEPLLFYQVAPQFVLTRLSAPRFRPTIFFL
jgi:hypothetical protein